MKSMQIMKSRTRYVKMRWRQAGKPAPLKVWVRRYAEYEPELAAWLRAKGAR